MAPAANELRLEGKPEPLCLSLTLPLLSADVVAADGVAVTTVTALLLVLSPSSRTTLAKERIITRDTGNASLGRAIFLCSSHLGSNKMLVEI